MQSFTFRFGGDPLKRNPGAWARSVRLVHLPSGPPRHCTPRLSRSFKFVGGYLENKLCNGCVSLRTCMTVQISVHIVWSVIAPVLLIPGPKHRVTKNFKIAALSRMDDSALEAANICHLTDMDIFELP
jgi:hypothetical protein